jgi:hypothetical protein
LLAGGKHRLGEAQRLPVISRIGGLLGDVGCCKTERGDVGSDVVAQLLHRGGFAVFGVGHEVLFRHSLLVPGSLLGAVSLRKGNRLSRIAGFQKEVAGGGNDRIGRPVSVFGSATGLRGTSTEYFGSSKEIVATRNDTVAKCNEFTGMPSDFAGHPSGTRG